MAAEFGKIFSRALKYPLRKDVFFLLLMVQLIFGVLIWFISGYFMGDLSSLESTAALGRGLTGILYAAPVVIASWIVTIFLMIAYMDNSMKFYKGRRDPLMKSFALARQRFIPFIGTIILLALIFMGCFGIGMIILLIPAFLQAAETLWLAIAVVWILVGSVIGIVIFFMTFLSPVICVIDRKGPIESIKRSWKLIAGNKVNTFIFLVIYMAIFISVFLVASLPETIYIILTGATGNLSLGSLAFLIYRTFFTVYLMLFAYSSDVNYYLSIK